MIRQLKIWMHRASIKTALRMLPGASPEERQVLCRDLAVSRLRLSQLEA